MQAKQLYATLEFAENEVRLLILEYYTSRFNILRIEQIKTDCIQDKKIVKPQVLTSVINKLIKNAETILGFKINNVILCIPSVDVKTMRKRINVAIEEEDKIIRLSHIRLALHKATHTAYDAMYEFVNVGSITYTVGGISSRTLPVDERAEQLTIEVELIYANKEIVHSYVQCVENAGVGIADICLDSFALAEECAILEKSMDKAMVLIDLQKEQTTLSLFFKGRMLECGVLPDGFGKWMNDLRMAYQLSEHECEKLLKESCFDEKGIYDDMIAYIWLDQDKHKEVDKKSLYQCIELSVENWLAAVNEVCDPIITQSNSMCVVTGEGADIVGVHSLLQYINMESELYIPTTIGAREAKYAACIGATYCVKRMDALREQGKDKVEVLRQTSAGIKKEEENGFTKKLKSFLQVK